MSWRTAGLTKKSEKGTGFESRDTWIDRGGSETCSPSCGVPRKSIANVDVKIERRCWTFFALLVLENANARFTIIPPRPWQMNISGRLEAPQRSRSVERSATSCKDFARIHSDAASLDSSWHIPYPYVNTRAPGNCVCRRSWSQNNPVVGSVQVSISSSNDP